MPNSRLRRRTRNRLAYTTRNPRMTATKTETLESMRMTALTASDCCSVRLMTAVWSLMEAKA